jgi:hypothetical protein
MSHLQHAALRFPLLGTLDKLLIFTMRKSFFAIINQAEGVAGNLPGPVPLNILGP